MTYDEFVLGFIVVCIVSGIVLYLWANNKGGR